MVHHVQALLSALSGEPAEGEHAPEGGGGKEHPAHGEGEEHDEETDFSWIVLMLVGIIIVSIIFETFTSFLEHKYRKDHNITIMLQKIYKELMILGFISFVLGIVENHLEIDELALETFEAVHTWVFLMSIFFVVFSVLLLFVLNIISNRVYKKESLNATGLQELEPRTENNRRSWAIRMLWGSSLSWDAYYYSAFEKVFVRLNPMSVTKEYQQHFCFGAWFQATLSEMIIEMLEITNGTWFVLMFIFLLVLAVEQIAMGTTHILANAIPDWVNVVALVGWGQLAGMVVLLVLVRRSKIKLEDFADLHYDDDEGEFAGSAEVSIKKDVESGGEESGEESEGEGSALLGKSSRGLSFGKTAIFPCNSSNVVFVPLKVLNALEMLYCAGLAVKMFEASDHSFHENKPFHDAMLVLPIVLIEALIKPFLYTDLAYVRCVTHFDHHLFMEIYKQEVALENNQTKIKSHLLAYLKNKGLVPQSTKQIDQACVDATWKAIGPLDAQTQSEDSAPKGEEEEEATYTLSLSSVLAQLNAKSGVDFEEKLLAHALRKNGGHLTSLVKSDLNIILGV